MIHAIGHALALAGSMTWEILWAVILGFFLSAVVQAVVRKSTIVGLMEGERGIAGSMEGHAAMDMSVPGDGSFWRRLASRQGFTSVSHVFVMEWAAILRDLILGLLIAGA